MVITAGAAIRTNLEVPVVASMQVADDIAIHVASSVAATGSTRDLRENFRMADRSTSDEYYVLDLCDEVIGEPGRRQATFDWLRGDPSAKRPFGTKLPVDGYWPSLALVVEFQEEQHSEPSPFFDRRHTVSGVGRGEQRRLYDARKRLLVPEHGLRLVVVEKSAFLVRSKRIVRDRLRDVALVRDHLSSISDLPAADTVGTSS